MMLRDILLMAMLTCATIGASQSSAASIDSIMRETSSNHSDVGISVGLLMEGDKYFFEAGYTDRNDGQKVDSSTVFEIGSVTKLMTAYLLSQQVDDGKIELDSFIDIYMPATIMLSPVISNRIKVSDLASHQAGLPDFNFAHLIALDALQPLDGVTLAMVDSLLAGATDLDELGTYHYSNISYVLLGYILEQVCGDSFENILSANLTKPLGLLHTSTSAEERSNVAMGYSAAGEPRPPFNSSAVMSPAGLVKSSASDLLEFVNVLLDEWHSSLTDRLETTYFKNTNIELGLGLNILRDEKSVVYAKTGDTLGQSSVLAYNPDQGWGLVILTNEASGVARELYSKILDVLRQ